MKKNSKKKRSVFNKIVRDIKNIKIQGARNIAEKALYAYNLFPTKSSKKKLLSIRPTEPMLRNVLNRASNSKNSQEQILKHFDFAQEKINESALKIIKNNDIIMTHCHSTTVVNTLIYAKKKGKKFSVYNTETRPLFQGRQTFRELKKAKIPVTMFLDSAMGIALSKEQKTKKVDKVFIGADALLKKGIVNKVGSETLAKLAKTEKIPVYILADSWKFSKDKIALEQRDLKEIWKSSKNSINFKIKNPAFEFVPKKYIKEIISEFGLMSYNKFLKRVKKS